MEKKRLSGIIHYSVIAIGIAIIYVVATSRINGTSTGLWLTVLGILIIITGIYKGKFFQMIIDLISGLF